jgi:hypothetical protein
MCSLLFTLSVATGPCTTTVDLTKPSQPFGISDSTPLQRRDLAPPLVRFLPTASTAVRHPITREARQPQPHRLPQRQHIHRSRHRGRCQRGRRGRPLGLELALSTGSHLLGCAISATVNERRSTKGNLASNQVSHARLFASFNCSSVQHPLVYRIRDMETPTIVVRF